MNMEHFNRLTPALRFWRVSFLDWLWFVFYLRCDEFSDKLDLINYLAKGKGLSQLQRDRNRAHKVDMALSA
jgi:hypothetical protein